MTAHVGDVVPAPDSWRGACAPLSAASDAQVEAAILASDKASYFQALQRHTNLSLFRHVLPPSDLPRFPTTASVAFVGDSLMRELSLAWHGLAPNGSTQFVDVSLVDLAARHLALTSTMTDSQHEDTRLRRQVQNGSQHEAWPPQALSAQQSERLRLALDAFNTTCGGFDALFVGGFALHRLLFLREAVAAIPHLKAASPVGQFANELRQWLRTLARLAAATQRPIVYVGSPTVHAATRVLSPPANNWDTFGDLSLLQLWGTVERSLEREMRREMRHEIMPNASGSSQHQTPPLFFLHLSELTQRCGAARCDGMHFGSDFPAWGCYSSSGLLFPFMAEYLRQTTGLIEAIDVAAAQRRAPACRALAPGADDSTCRRHNAPWRTCSGRVGYAHMKGMSLGCHCYDLSSLRTEQMTPWLHSYT